MTAGARSVRLTGVQPRTRPIGAAEVQAAFGPTSALDRDRSVSDSASGQFRTRRTVETTAMAFAKEQACRAVADLCEDALIKWPNAKAVILFGSRARGDHRDDSDWDIAFITDSEESLPTAVYQDLKKLETRESIVVQGFALSQERFCEDACSLGNIAAPIAREGQLIAGRCGWPKLESEPTLKLDEYLDWRSRGMIRIAFASNNLAKAIDDARTGSTRAELGEFVAASSDAAERFAKIAFGKLASGTGVDIPRGHQVNEIVKALDRVLERSVGPNAAWWRSDRGMKVRDLLCKMNGHGHEDHQSGYPGSTINAEVIARAANRLAATVSFAILEVEELPDSEDLRQAAKEVSGSYWTSMRESASRLRRVLQDIDPSNLTYASASSTFAESVSTAVNFGEEIVQALKKLAESLHEETRK